MFKLKLKGKDNTVSLRKWLAVLFFLLSPYFVSCSDRVDLHNAVFFVQNGQLYKVYSTENDLNEEIDINNIKKETVTVKTSIFQKSNVKLLPREMTTVEEHYVLARDSQYNRLLLLNSEGKLLYSKKFEAGLVFMNEKFLVSQTSSFEGNEGFKFKMYRINLNLSKKVFNLEKLWEGNLDCFVSDTVFYDKGVFVAGGTQDNKEHMVYNIFENEGKTYSITKCFTVPKNKSFLRIITSDTGTDEEPKLYAFLSSGNKSVYSLDYKNNKYYELDLSFPDNFSRFFGYGFCYNDKLIIPASISNDIHFISLDYSGKSYSICENITGCILPVGLLNGKYIYISKDPEKPEQFYGVSMYDGKSVTNLFSLN